MSVYQQRAVVIDGVVDALGVIVGLTRLHLPAEQGTTDSSGCNAGERHAQSLCGLTTGRIVTRDGVEGGLPMCVICMNVAANLILTAEQIGGRVRARHRVASPRSEWIPHSGDDTARGVP